MLYGYMGNILEIDLTREIIKHHKLDKNLIPYIGGRGFGAKLLWDLTGANTDPLSGDNPLIISTGPLLGALVPGACKTSLVTLSPSTNIYGDSNIGGLAGLRLKQSNNDVLIIRGKSKRPVIITINDLDVKILSGESYWGMSTFDAEQSIKNDLGNNSFEVMTIGIAGENLVRCANIQTRHRHSGRTGIGAVMGSKKIKGIAINGTHSIRFSNSKKLMETFTIANSYLVNHPLINFWHKKGTMGLFEDVGDKELLPVNNFRDVVFEDYFKIGGEMFKKKYPKQKTQTCLFCGIACEGVVEINGKIQVRPQYENVAMLGSNCGITDLDHVLESNYLCDYYGLDTISVGNLIALAMEGYEKKIILNEELGGIKLNFGKTEGIHKFIKILAENKGIIGKTFSKGIKKVVEKWPKLKDFAMHCKGLEQSGYETRPLPGMTLAYATCDIGAHHNRAWVAYQEMLDHPNDQSIAKLVCFHQHIRPLMDCL
ncbi:MAG: aldehyde ferredoxin oxidoreductase family protein, partial [Candidatus Helarchaeota archaeon]